MRWSLVIRKVAVTSMLVVGVLIVAWPMGGAWSGQTDPYGGKPKIPQSTVVADVISAIETFFQIAESPTEELKIGNEVEGQMFGQDVSFSQLLATSQNVDGVFSISNLTPSSDIAVEAFEIAILATGSPVVNVVGSV